MFSACAHTEKAQSCNSVSMFPSPFCGLCSSWRLVHKVVLMFREFVYCWYFLKDKLVLLCNSILENNLISLELK